MLPDNFFRLMYEYSMEAALFTAPDGAILAANPAACQLFGRTEKELCAAGRAGVVDPESPRLAQILEERARTGRARGELTFVRGDGSRFPGEISSVQVGDEAGPIRTVMFVRDLTDRKRLEKEREQYFRLFRLTSEPMCIADPFGCFLRVNPAFAAVTGYTENELISKPFLNFVHPDDRARTEEEMRLQVAKRPSMQFENRYVRKDGTNIYLSWFAYFDKTDQVTYATARDVTQTRLVEANLAESRSLLGAMIDSSPDLIWSVDNNGFRLLAFNSGLREYCAREHRVAIAVGMSPADILRDENLVRRWHELYARTLRDGGHAVDYVSPASGRTLRLRLNLLSREGRVFGVSVFGHDITEPAA